MNNFDWDGFIRGGFIVNCKTEEDAEDFFDKCKLKGLTWESGDVLGDTEWCHYQDRTCYRFHRIGLNYSPNSYYKKENKEIVTWERDILVNVNIDCNSCLHETVCKYKEEYIRVRDKYNSSEFKGIFDMACNEYAEDNIKINNTYKGFLIGDYVNIKLFNEMHTTTGKIIDIKEHHISISTGKWTFRVPLNKIETITYSLWK